MPPKGRKAGGDKGRTEAEEVEEALQAVVLADSFETRFRPLTLERPRCLLPLANTPLIEYTLEFLAASGVQEVYLYPGVHTSQVEAYFENSRWTGATSPFDHFEILRSPSQSVGDAMRDLDARSLLNDDFLLVYGDVVSNLSLQPALAAHKTRKVLDKNSVMTMVLRQAGLGHRTKSQEALPCFVIEPGTDRCLAYEQLSGHGSKTLDLDSDILASDDLQIRTDLIDCGVDIITPDVLALWSDNFDYEEPRRGFLHSVLKDYELNGKKLHTYITTDGYGARARNLRAYGAITRDMLGRWTYPIVPDANLVSDQTYKMYRGGSCREDGVSLASTCDVGKRSVLGKGTAVGDGAIVKDSVVGRRCVIGRNVRLTGSYIWDDVTIGDGSVIADAIVANEASMGKKCIVKPGAIISFGCHLADGTVVAEKTRITRMVKTGNGEEVIRGEPDVRLVGKGGEGFAYGVDEDEDEEAHLSLGPSSLYKLGELSLSQESISTIHSHGDLSLNSDTPRTGGSRTASFGSDFATPVSDEGTSTIAGLEPNDDSAKRAREFHRDASTSLYDSLQQGADWSSMQLELTGLRLSHNAEQSWVRRAITVAFMKYISTLMEGGMSAKDAVSKAIVPQEELIKRSMSDHGEDREDKPDQVDFLLRMQADLKHRKDGEKIMLFASNELAMQDIVETDGFLQWWDDSRSTEGEDMLQVRSMMQPFMDAIGDDSEEDDDEEDDEDDEDED